MATEDKFKASVVAILAKRAANRCSNPDCYCITSGPADTPTASVNVGEAAHIYGAKPGSARYRAEMTSAERAAISNAIWLCNNCHKLVDDDEVRYPDGLLFEWQRGHEHRIALQVGKAGAEIRDRYEQRHLEEFGKLSYIAERIILEKGPYWEYHLTAEVLRFDLAPIVRRWEGLKRGNYVRPTVRIKNDDFFGWVAGKFAEMSAIVHAFAEIANVDFTRAWGEPGVPGSDIDIVETSRLFAELCRNALEWEEAVCFVHVDDMFSELQTIFKGVAGGLIEEVAKVPPFFTAKLAEEGLEGTHILSLSPELPDGWLEKAQAAMARATEAYQRYLQD